MSVSDSLVDAFEELIRQYEQVCEDNRVLSWPSFVTHCKSLTEGYRSRRPPRSSKKDGERVRTNVPTLMGWMGEGTVISDTDGLLVILKKGRPARGGFGSANYAMVLRDEVTVLSGND